MKFYLRITVTFVILFLLISYSVAKAEDMDKANAFDKAFEEKTSKC